MREVIYWRWKGEKYICKSYIQEDLGNILELSNEDMWTNYPTRILKEEIEIIKPEQEKEKEQMKKKTLTK